ncbi:hypothetical protein [Sedimentibacter sp. zth1]|nr:hypothetical protein [Sedimentibacter sp. zth1]
MERKHKIVDRRAGDIAFSYADASKAERELDDSPHQKPDKKANNSLSILT